SHPFISLLCSSSFCCFRVLLSFPTRRSSDLLAVIRRDAVDKHVDDVGQSGVLGHRTGAGAAQLDAVVLRRVVRGGEHGARAVEGDRKSTRLNSSHVSSSYAVFCLKTKKKPY